MFCRERRNCPDDLLGRIRSTFSFSRERKAPKSQLNFFLLSSLRNSHLLSIHLHCIKYLTNAFT